MLDAHRILVDNQNILENFAKLKRFKALADTGYISYEPFVDSLYMTKNIGKELKESMNFIRKSVA